MPKKATNYRIQPDDKYWAIAVEWHEKGRAVWHAKSWYQTLDEAAVALLHLLAAKKVEEPYDVAALLKAVSLAESRVLAAVAQASVSHSAPRGSRLDAPAPQPN